MTRYRAVLFGPDGDWTTGHRNMATIEEVEQALANQGSMFYFYPFHGVIVDHGFLTTSRQRMVSMAPPFEGFKGKSIRTFARFVPTVPDDDISFILTGGI